MINNSGGQIFSSLYDNPALQTPHSMGFKKWAELFNSSYTLWTPGKKIEEKTLQVIEVRPDNNETQKVRQRLSSEML